MPAANMILWNNHILESKPTDAAALPATAPTLFCS
jgi:hypothetical protein